MISKSDLRVLKTRECIKNAFSNLLLEKNFQDITVQNICTEALVGRSTFYDHFCDKYDLLNKMVEEIVKDFNQHIKRRFTLSDSNDFTKAVHDMIKHFSTKRNTIKALLNVQTETTNLYNDLKNILAEACSCYLENKKFVSKYNVSNKYICAQYTSYVLTSLQFWLESSENNNNLELANKIQEILFESDNVL